MMNGQREEHTTVLLEEAVTALVWHRDGYYVDGTFGRGGHSRRILQNLSPAGHLLAIDKDPQAVTAGAQLLSQDDRVEVVQGSFTQMRDLLMARHCHGQVAGVLLDLGVSSPQLDEAERGFSFTHNGPLDMRMDTTRGESAAQWLATVAEADLIRVLKTYGEEKFAKRIARAIVRERELTEITTTHQLAKIVAEAHPAWEVGKHPATRTFLALRLWLNQELEDLRVLLEQVVDALMPGGRLVVISFHSLEDRIVKRFIRRESTGGDVPRHLPLREDQMQRRLRAVGKAVKPSAEEIAHNVRSRSAVMRVAEKMDSAQ